MNKYKIEQKNPDKNKAPKAPNKGEKLLLHACCGPCTLEPYRLLKEAGWNITIMYSNSNIFPKSEYEHRFETLENWCSTNDIELIKDNYDDVEWQKRVLKYGEDKQGSEKRKKRCGECYMIRLEHAAKFACENNYKYLASSLAVSPYQYNDLLKNKLDDVCAKYNLNPVFMDFRPYYSAATKRSKELEMYRQKYCGCEFSLQESIAQFKRSKNKKYLAELKSIIDNQSNHQDK